MPIQLCWRQTQSSQGRRHPVRRVVAHEHEGPTAVRIDNGNGLAAEPGRKFQHVGRILARSPAKHAGYDTSSFTLLAQSYQHVYGNIYTNTTYVFEAQ